MLRKNEFVERFNIGEQKRRRLLVRKLERRARFPRLSENFHRALDRLDALREKLAPADCVSGKRVGYPQDS